MSDGTAVLNSKVLVLNRSFLPIHVTSVRRAFCMLYQNIAHAVDEQYQTFDFQSWSELSVRVQDESIGLVDRMIRVPRVILLLAYNGVPKRQVRFTRYNIYLRDRNTCQYCGRSGSRGQLNIDHVVPRHRGGKSTWENVVCSCLPCNHRKGGRTPEEAGMKLLRRPRRPAWAPFVREMFSLRRYPEWLPFLSSTVDASYWNAELEP